MRVFTREPKHRQPGEGKDWPDLFSLAFGTMAGIMGMVVLGSEVGFRLLSGFEVIEVASDTLWGFWRAFFGFTACGLVSAAFLAGSPAEIGRKALEVIVGKMGNGGGD